MLSHYTGTFNSECESLVIYEQSLIILPSAILQNAKLLICTFQGTIKQNLDCDGQPIAVHLNQSYLIAATIIGMLQIWDLSRRYDFFLPKIVPKLNRVLYWPKFFFFFL